MKIDNVSPLPTPSRVEPGHNEKKTAEAADHRQAASGSVTHLSHAGTDARQDIDQARVAELREAIAEGRLTIDPRRIADRLLAGLHDLPGGDQ